jgi:hypothetical protein
MAAERPLRFGFDIDDVIFPTARHVIDIYNDLYGTKLAHDQWYKVDDYPLWGAASLAQRGDRVNEICNDPSIVELIKPFEGAEQVLRAMARRGDFLAAITGRPSGENAPLDLREITLQQLERYFPGIYPPEQLYMTNHYAEDPAHRIPKLRIIEGLDLDGYFEDHLDHANQTGQAGVPTYLYGDGYSWNQDGAHESLVRVANWRGVATIAGLDYDELLAA